MAIVLLFAITYVKYGSIPEVGSILYGIEPVIIAVVLQALYRLGKSVIKDKLSFMVLLFVLAFSFLGISEVPLLFITGFIMMGVLNREKIKDKFFSISILPLSFLIFLKIGSVLYGSGYVLLAFLEAEFVEKLGILTNQQLLDAVAVGQLTSGPVFTPRISRCNTSNYGDIPSFFYSSLGIKSYNIKAKKLIMGMWITNL